MAYLIVRIEDADSLPLNEFFDYNGRCYAVTRPRGEASREAIRMEDFYEASIDTTVLEQVPVFFAVGGSSQVSVIGWYKQAKIYREIQPVSLFLEGNIEAMAADAVWLPDEGEKVLITWGSADRLYEVIEEEDIRHDKLKKLLTGYLGENAMQRYAALRIGLEPKIAKNADSCLEFCQRLAGQIVGGQFRSIVEVKSLELYAKKAMETSPKDPDGYYYHALACYQLGFFKNGIRSVERAIRLEPEASDLQALKGMLLTSRGYYEQGAQHLQIAFEQSGEEEYLLQQGRVYIMAGQMDKAYECLKRIKDETLLDNAGIRLEDMEKKWSFASIRGLKLKDFWKKKKEKH